MTGLPLLWIVSLGVVGFVALLVVVGWSELNPSESEEA